MKRIILLPICLLLMACFVSCETDTIDGDGKIEGFWHLESIETLATDSTTDSITDMSKRYFFWSFQRNLLELSDKTEETRILLCRFNVGGGRLTITEVFLPSYGSDVPTTDVSLLKPYGIDKLNATFTYSIDGDNMTLTDERVRLRLKRF